jgi:hypothetical protein
MGDEYMTLDETSIKFKYAQTIRLGMLISVGILWLLQGFCLVRLAPFYISFWCLTFLFAALLRTSFSAGRKVVEVKMLEKLKAKRKEEGIDDDANDEVKLPPEEVMQNWKSGIILFSIALPLTMLSPIIFYATPMS